MPSRSDRLAGCLIGLCLGDALGAPVEALLSSDALRYVREVLRAGRAGAWTRPPYPFGQYTDDGQLARELLISFSEQHGFDPAATARRIAHSAETVGFVGLGPGSRGAIERLLLGVPWDLAGTPAPYAGNGSAIRVAPFALLFASQPDALARAVIEQSRITHQDPRCAAGALVIAEAARQAARPGSVSASAILDTLAERVEGLDGSVAAALRWLEEVVKLEPDEAIGRFEVSGLDPSTGDGPWRGVSAFVTLSVCWALYAFLRSPDDYWETVCTAILPGGDTDSTAAMAGAIAGARLGLDALPASLARRLTDRGAWGYEDLVGLAERCAVLASASGSY